MITNSLPLLNDSELKFSYESISKALTNQILDNGKPDISESLNILKKFYNKDNPILDINKTLPMFGTWTPLAVASYSNNYRVLQFLIENGADVNLSYDNLSYPLHFAAAKGNETCIMYLLKAGADVNKKDAKGRTALLRACERVDMKKTTIELFFNKNICSQDIDINILVENQGCLDIAKEKGSPEIAKYLSYIILSKNLGPKGMHKKRIKI
jgi:ankyrin repeat protein